MLHQRLQTANRKAEKRFAYFHTNSEVNFGPGVYRKRKGCECRGCTSRKQDAQHTRNKILRREKTVLQ